MTEPANPKIETGLPRIKFVSPAAARIAAPPQAIAQIWTDPESDHPGPSIVITTHGVDPATRTPAHPRYRDWLPHRHGDADQDILASAATALDAAGWSLLCPWAVDDIGWRATVVRQPPITHRATDLVTSPEISATAAAAAARVFAPKQQPVPAPKTPAPQRHPHTRGGKPMKDLTATDRRLGEALAQRDEAALSRVADEFAAAGLPAMAQLLRERGTAGAAELLAGMSALTGVAVTGTLSPASARLVAPMQARRHRAVGTETE
ncbi:hypothetical protein [Nocardia farcinica]|uniref:hypothetical protein n=1 Tax=Nocardia farcinica TaxID=37329 RepID=UPI0018934C4E|nr:hypothetical protein [Nocardia farcinica]MBF6271272.1 hypothetical protein [Nocardia farcinica]